MPPSASQSRIFASFPSIVSAVAFAGTDSIWVTADRLYRLSIGGNIEAHFDVSMPSRLVALNDGSAWLSTRGNSISHIDRTGNLLSSFSLATSDWRPVPLFIDKQGKIWTTAGLEQVVQRYDASGDLLFQLNTVTARSFAEDSRGTMWVAGFEPNEGVVGITTDGNIVTRMAIANPTKIAIDGEDNLWVLSQGASNGGDTIFKVATKDASASRAIVEGKTILDFVVDQAGGVLIASDESGTSVISRMSANDGRLISRASLEGVRAVTLAAGQNEKVVVGGSLTSTSQGVLVDVTF